MDKSMVLDLCAAYAREAGLECQLEKEGVNGNPFDLLLVPEFQQNPAQPQDAMALCVFFTESRYAFMDRMQFDLLNLTGYVQHVTRPETLRELRAFLGEVNFQLPVGAFGVDAEGTVFLRYTLPLPREMEAAAFLRQFGIAFSLLNAFSLAFLRPIFAVIRGERTAKTAMELAGEELNAIYDALHQNGEKNGQE